VELLVRPVFGVTVDHLLRGFLQAGPPAFETDLRHQEVLAMPVDRSLRHAHDQAEVAALLFPGAFDGQIDPAII
jgi:hypothetical protein